MKAIAEVAKKAAVISGDTASLYGMYQPKVPKELLEEKEVEE